MGRYACNGKEVVAVLGCRANGYVTGGIDTCLTAQPHFQTSVYLVLLNVT